jgi:nucleoside-diphosphate-sugar epimerase
MKILVTGATGYIGSAIARALASHDHHVLGLARSPRAARALREAGLKPVMGDFGDRASLIDAVTGSSPDAVVSTASLGSRGGDANTFTQDRNAIAAIITALGDNGKTLVFTSGSAVFGVFSAGSASDTVYDENAAAPLPRAVFAPASAGVHPMLVHGFGAAMAARVDTERAVTSARGIRGIVVRPGLVYGNGGSYDLPAAIALARRHRHGVHLGAGAMLQSYVHIDDLAELYCLAIEHAPGGTTLHGTTADISQQKLAAAIGRLVGADGPTENLTLNRMMGLNAAFRAGLLLTRHLPANVFERVQPAFTPPVCVATGISLCLNKRLSSSTTQQLLGWSPRNTDILADVETGSYAQPVAAS